MARVGNVELNASGEALRASELRQRACTELLRQEAMECGLLDGDDPASGDGVISAAAAHAIEALLERELSVPPPDEAACRRHHAAHGARYSSGERVQLRHVLFAVTDGVDIGALRSRAEQVLLDLRTEPQRFDAVAREQSNCPSGAEGGALGWLRRGECADEFAREVFAQTEVGVLPRLVHSRHGLHVVEVLAREPGERQPFEAVRGAVALALRQQAWVTALRQYLRVLAARHPVDGVALDAVDSPLVQ
jgi:peptidyl-prolyl cis-trans isomerase C